MSGWMLRIEDGPELDLPGTCLILGRDDDCDIPVDEEHPSVSRRHARLEPLEDGVMITDLGSRNGTHLNGRRLHEPAQALHGDVIQFGRLRATLSGGPPPRKSPAARADTQYMEAASCIDSGSEPVPAGYSRMTSAAIESRPATAGPPPGARLMVSGAVASLSGFTGWAFTSNRLAEMQGIAGQLLRYMDESARSDHAWLQIAQSLSGWLGIGGAALFLVGLVNYARRS